MCVYFFVCYCCTELLYVFACMFYCKMMSFIEWQLLCQFYLYVRSALSTNVRWAHLSFYAFEMLLRNRWRCGDIHSFWYILEYAVFFLFCVFALYCSLYQREVHKCWSCTFLLHWPVCICSPVLNLCAYVWVRERESESNIFGCVIFILFMLTCRMIQKVFSSYS